MYISMLTTWLSPICRGYYLFYGPTFELLFGVTKTTPLSLRLRIKGNNRFPPWPQTSGLCVIQSVPERIVSLAWFPNVVIQKPHSTVIRRTREISYGCILPTMTSDLTVWLSECLATRWRISDWWVSSYAFRMCRNTPDAEYASPPKMMVSMHPYCLYNARGWLGIRELIIKDQSSCWEELSIRICPRNLANKPRFEKPVCTAS